jgi:hypothetical protein
VGRELGGIGGSLRLWRSFERPSIPKSSVALSGEFAATEEI